MKTIKKVANGAKLGRMEWLETFYKTEKAKLVKLPSPRSTTRARCGAATRWARCS
jgi:hypothetical protein